MLLLDSAAARKTKSHDDDDDDDNDNDNKVAVRESIRRTCGDNTWSARKQTSRHNEHRCMGLSWTADTQHVRQRQVLDDRRLDVPKKHQLQHRHLHHHHQQQQQQQQL